MGIKSTRFITTEEACNRINYLMELVENNNFKRLEAELDEEYYVIYNIVSIYSELYQEYVKLNEIYGQVYNWSDKVLGDFMDYEGIRFSRFENYIIKN